MAEDKEKKERLKLTVSDEVEDPEVTINADPDASRREAFKETYKRIAKIIPEYFIIQRMKRKKATSSGGTSFTQNIFVNQNNVKLETKEVTKEEKQGEKEDKERQE